MPIIKNIKINIKSYAYSVQFAGIRVIFIQVVKSIELKID